MVMVRSDYDDWKTEGWYTKDLLPTFREVIHPSYKHSLVVRTLTPSFLSPARELSKPT